MTNEEAKKMLKAKLECLKNETSGINHDCNMRLCDGCSLNYEQGNMGEQKEALEMAIQALEQQPCEDCVSREAVMHALEKCHKQCCREDDVGDEWIHYETTENEMECIPSVTSSRPRGKWIVLREEYEFMGGIVNEPRGCKCSNCDKVVRFKSVFCPNCGSYNGGGEDAE